MQCVLREKIAAWRFTKLKGPLNIYCLSGYTRNVLRLTEHIKHKRPPARDFSPPKRSSLLLTSKCEISSAIKKLFSFSLRGKFRYLKESYYCFLSNKRPGSFINFSEKGAMGQPYLRGVVYCFWAKFLGLIISKRLLKI